VIRPYLKVAAALLACVSPALAQQGGVVPVQVVEGRLVVSCDVSSPYRRIPVNLFLEFESVCGLQLHNKAAAPLRLESEDGQLTPVTIHFPDFEIVVSGREHGDEEDWEEFTKYNSHEIGENAVVGVIGAEVFAAQHIVFDLAGGFIELSNARERSAEGPPEREGSTTLPITLHNNMAWLPVRYEDGQPAAMGIGTVRYDSTIDYQVADEFGRPAGNIGPLRAGDIDLSEYVALRPEEVILVHPDGVAGVTGLGLLEHFRVEIDRVNRWVMLTPTEPADFPAEDLEFFEALVLEDADAIEAFLDVHPDVRLSREAATLLIDLRLAEFAEPEAVTRAIRFVNDTMPADLRATRLYDLMVAFSDEGHPDHVVTAGELAIESGRKDRYPNRVHEVHSKLGDVLLQKGEGQRAWRHLLSAAFGMPEDGLINLNLGLYYESTGRLQRAYSRFVQACIKPESGPKAIEALERVGKLLPDEEKFSIELFEKLIGGKVRSFGAASQFEPSEINFTGRVALVEFFTNAHLGDGDRGAIGGALGNQGLISHYPPENVAFLSYHLPVPSLDPLVNELASERAAQIGIGEPTVQVVNGTEGGPGAARWRDGEAIYNDLRKKINQQLLKETDYTLKCTASIAGDDVRGELIVEGPDSRHLRVHIVLAEAGVLFPGKTTVVVHRMVARAPLTASFDGEEFDPEDGSMVIAFQEKLSEITAENEAYLDDIVAAGGGMTARMSMKIDPREVRIVAFLTNVISGEVIQAIQIDPEGPQEAD
jgi:hypothetical protein